jgi:tetratricopeptide (TPR) repeat protein
MKKSIRLQFPVFIFFITLFFSTHAFSLTFSPKNFISTMITKFYLMGQKYEPAQNEMLNALRKSPLEPELHMNLGLAQMGLGQIGKALGSFKMAEELTNNPELKFVSRFNQAMVLAQDKKINEALEMYQKALELVPSSKEVKTNIELLMQQQSGKGGEGENKDQPQDNKDSKDGKNNKEPKDFKNNDKYKPKFDSKSLSEGDVKKILEEIKRQEQQIHGNEERQKQNQKDTPNDKDW